MQKIVTDLIGSPAPVIEQVARAIQIKGAEPVKGMPAPKE